MYFLTTSCSLVNNDCPQWLQPLHTLEWLLLLEYPLSFWPCITSWGKYLDVSFISFKISSFSFVWSFCWSWNIWLTNGWMRLLDVLMPNISFATVMLFVYSLIRELFTSANCIHASKILKVLLICTDYPDYTINLRFIFYNIPKSDGKNPIASCLGKPWHDNL